MNDSILHPLGEPKPTALTPWSGPVAVDTLGGRVHVEWDPQATVTKPRGQVLQSSIFEFCCGPCPDLFASNSPAGCIT